MYRYRFLPRFSLCICATVIGFMMTACNSTTGDAGGGGDLPILSYVPATVVDTVGKPATHAATLSGGTPTGCVSSPALPAGLTLSATTCVITGIPGAVSASMAYAITASNANGSDTAILNLSIVAASDTSTIDPGANPLGELNGIALTSGSHTWKLKNARTPPAFGTTGKRRLVVENVDLFTEVNGVPGYGDTTRYQGVWPRTLTLWVKQALGAQTCATGDSITLEASPPVGSLQIFGSTACSVQVDYMSAFGGMSGKIISATLATPAGNTLTIQNAQFRGYKHYGKTGTMPTLATDTSVHITMQIDSGSFDLPQGRYFRMDSTNTPVGPGSSFGYSYVTNDGTYGQDKITLFIASLSNVVGVHQCGELFSGGYTSLQVWLGNYGYERAYFSGRANGATVGNCSINLTNPGRGNYQATLIVNASNDTTLLSLPQRTITIHGEFRR